MTLKDLRSVIQEQVKTNVTVKSGDSTAESGILWLFSVDDSIDDLRVVDLYPNGDVLELTLECAPSELLDNDWSSVFNQDAVVSIQEGTTTTLTED